MATTPYKQALDDYYNICEIIFNQWKSSSLQSGSLWRGFSTLHCTEPYLLHKVGMEPLLFITHNPGAEQPFQHIDRLSEEGSLLDSKANYSATAKRLVHHYQSDNSINSAASTRIKKMIEFSNRLGSDGLLQVELFPLHSKKRPPDKYLFEVCGQPDLFAQYQTAVRNLLSYAPAAVAISGAAPVANHRSVKNWLHLLRIENTEPLILSDDGRATVGVFAQVQSQGQIRILFCTQGHNGVPAPHRWKTVFDAVGK